MQGDFYRMQSILSLENISYSYHNLNGETPALSNITFRAAEGEFLAIVGPSGCGKSTLLSIIAGLLKPESGVLSFSRASTIGYMLQRDHLFEWRTIYQNVIEKIAKRRKHAVRSSAFKRLRIIFFQR